MNRWAIIKCPYGTMVFPKLREEPNEESLLPPVATFGNMVRHAWNDHSCYSGDARKLNDRARFCDTCKVGHALLFVIRNVNIPARRASRSPSPAQRAGDR